MPNRPQTRMRLTVLGEKSEMRQYERRRDQTDRSQRFDAERDVA